MATGTGMLSKQSISFQKSSIMAPDLYKERKKNTVDAVLCIRKVCVTSEVHSYHLTSNNGEISAGMSLSSNSFPFRSTGHPNHHLSPSQRGKIVTIYIFQNVFLPQWLLCLRLKRLKAEEEKMAYDLTIKFASF